MIYWAEFINFTAFSGIECSSNVQLYSHIGFLWGPPQCYKNCGLGNMLEKGIRGWLSDTSPPVFSAHLWCWGLKEQTLISYWPLIVAIPYWLVVAESLGAITLCQHLLYMWALRGPNAVDWALFDLHGTPWQAAPKPLAVGTPCLVRNSLVSNQDNVHDLWPTVNHSYLPHLIIRVRDYSGALSSLYHWSHFFPFFSRGQKKQPSGSAIQLAI